MSKVITLDEWKKRFVDKHGDKYDYSKITNVKAKEKICIICPEHGEFWQTANNHYHGYGCPICGLEKVRKSHKNKNDKSRNEFTEKASCVHNNKYIYSKVKYIDAVTKVCIICPEHGEFWQAPSKHLEGHGCPKCAGLKKHTNGEFIEKAKEIHGNKYDYSKVNYINNKTPVCIICPEHGEFWQKPNDHLSGHGCHECNCHNHIKSFSNFLKIANIVHCGKYEYDDKTYVNRQTKTRIICPEHGEFWQYPSYHLQGNGCPVCGNKCNASEQKVLFELKKHFDNENIIYQYRNQELLGMMTFDIYMPKYKIAIEHQGIQHFEPVKKFGGINKLNETIERDLIKRKICNNNGINLFYVSLDKKVLKYSDEEMRIFGSVDELINEIEKLKNHE